MGTKLNKTEQKLLALFDTKRNEDGRIQVWTIPEAKAAYKLAEKGLVRVEEAHEYHSYIQKFNWGRNWQMSKSYLDRAWNIYKVQEVTRG